MTTLQTSCGPEYSRVISVGGARGSRVVTNDEMVTMIDSSDEWIQQRTGIRERRWVGPGESPLTMGVEAGRKALRRAGLSPDQIDTLIVSTVTHFKQTPSLAVGIAAELGIEDSAAMDLSAACAGFCYGIGMADTLVRGGQSTHVLVIGVEALSTITDTTDRATAFLFGDGAGAAVVGPSDEPAIGPTVWGSDPSQAEVIHTPDWREAGGAIPYIRMDGRPVFRWATTAIAERTNQALAAAGITPEQLDVFIPHQANNRITDAMLRHLALPDSVVVARDVKQMGNSSAASIPLAMEALLESGEAKAGDLALTIGFGAGLVYAGQVLRLPALDPAAEQHAVRPQGQDAEELVASTDVTSGLAPHQQPRG